MKKTIKYDIKKMRKLPIILGLAGLTMFAACDKDDDEKPKPRRANVMTLSIHPRDWTVTLKTNNLDSVYALCDTLYIEPERGWHYYDEDQINSLATSLSIKHANRPNMKGRGSFDFTPGVAAAEDSIKLINCGYAINAQKQR
ncbi:MAG: hypothetical protein IJ560_02160 [Alphaproteobacteria bacterium]|nr:hypothetical protein [Alphaproteobacteria bacterium]